MGLTINRRPSPNCCFFTYFSVSHKRNIKQNPNGTKPSRGSFLEQTQSMRLGVDGKKEMRRPRGRRTRPGGRHAPHPHGPLVDPPTYFLRLYRLLYPKNIQGSHETTFPPPQHSIPVRSHLGAFFDAPPEGESITEGFYINTIASPMMCE